MLLRSLLILNAAYLLGGAVVIDRVAIIVGSRVVKISDIDRDLRVSQFINREPIDISLTAKRKVAERLITQELIRQEIRNGGYSQPTEQDVKAFVKRLQLDRFKGSEAQFRSELARYGLTEDQLRQYLLWQLTVLRFIDERFRPGVLVTDEDVKSYYDTHRAELQKANPKNNSLEALDPKIRETLSGERVNQNLEEWLDQTRRRTRIQYREAAFQEGAASQAVQPQGAHQ